MNDQPEHTDVVTDERGPSDVDGDAGNDPGEDPGTASGDATAGEPADGVVVTAEVVDPPDPGDDEPLDLAGSAPDALVELAEALGVATEFWDWQGAHVPVRVSTIVGVLEALDVPLRTHADVRAALDAARERPWRQVLPDVVVTREGQAPQVALHVPADGPVRVWVDAENGEQWDLPAAVGTGKSHTLDGVTVEELTVDLPRDLPLGWHELVAEHGGEQTRRALVVTPERVPLPPALEHGRAWGFMTQLYSVRSRDSWGLGDLGDLAELVSWSAREHGAGFVLVNPLHAAEPVPPMEPSPYLPTTRRFVNPMYLRIEDIREVAYLPATDRAIVEWQAEAMKALNEDPAELDRDAVWAAKQSALWSVFVAPRSRARQASFDAFKAREGEGLVDFATWNALAERYGLPSADWPSHVADPRSLTVEHMRHELADRVEFHMWLQWCLDEQLGRVAALAREAGMPVGVVHDLAVGVHPDGADTWGLGDALARDVTAGAPPDAFNQQGQDWSQPPWRPDRLAALGYAPYRDMLRTVLRHAGALRVDHVVGLFRFWWVPNGHGPAEGTYVRYDHEALVGILALEATRAGAFVVGEDLGTVEPWARDYLRERGILGTSILWFEKDDQGRPLPPEAWRELCLATVTTHDLPPTAGYLAGEHIEIRERLGLLTRPVAEEAAVDAADREAVLEGLRELGLLGESPTERDKVEALHRFLARTPAKLVGVALADAVGDRRAMNQPGTSTEYPNWRLPLADGVGRPVLLEELMTAIRVTTLAATVQAPDDGDGDKAGSRPE